MASSSDELLKTVQQFMASRATSPTPAPVMSNAQNALTQAPPPIAVTPSISANPREASSPPVATLRNIALTPDAAVATDANGQEVGVSTSVSSPTFAKALQTKPSPSDSMGQATRKLNAVDGMSEFVISKKHGKLYVVYRAKGSPKVFAIGSSELNGILRSSARGKGKRLKKHQLDEINAELLSAAEEFGTEVDLHNRIHPIAGGGVEVDTCDGLGTTVRVTEDGMQVMTGTSETLFIQASSAKALPRPIPNGDFRLLRKYLNLEAVSFLLYIGWTTYTIAGAKIEATKYVFLVLKGAAGTGKSWASKVTKAVIDPNVVNAQTLPGNARDLAIMLQSTHLTVIDNMRDLTAAMSDILCGASTGSSYSPRKLYSDDETKALYLHGAMLFNGIHPFIGEADFAARCLVLTLIQILGTNRKSESQMLAEFEADLPSILGGLYELIATILKKLPMADVLVPSRMLDFCRWLAAMESALDLEPGVLQLAYDASLRDAQLESLLDNPLALTIIEFSEAMDESEWVGTPTDFYDRLSRIAEFSLQRSRAWPSSAAVLSKRLHGLQAPLLTQGISIDWTRGKDRQIVIRCEKVPAQLATQAVAIAPSLDLDSEY